MVGGFAGTSKGFSQPADHPETARDASCLVEKIYPAVIEVIASADDLQSAGALTFGQKFREA
jgi:hypothetical protein